MDIDYFNSVIVPRVSLKDGSSTYVCLETEYLIFMIDDGNPTVVECHLVGGGWILSVYEATIFIVDTM